MSYMLLMIEEPGERLSPPEAERRDRYERMVRIRRRPPAPVAKLRTADALALPDRRRFAIRKRGQNHAVVDGPFAEAKEIVGGFFYLDVETREEAVAIAERVPGGGMVHRRGPPGRPLLRGHPVAGCRRIMVVSRRQETTVPANCHLHVAIVRLCSFNPIG